MDPHLSPFLSRGDLIAGDHLQQAKECEAIAEVLVQLLDLDADLTQVGVAPCCECL